MEKISIIIVPLYNYLEEIYLVVMHVEHLEQVQDVDNVCRFNIAIRIVKNLIGFFIGLIVNLDNPK